MNDRNPEHQILRDYKYLYSFETTDSNFRDILIYTKNETLSDKVDHANLEGLIFSNNIIKEERIPNTELNNILKKYDCKIIYFENFRMGFFNSYF